MQYSLSPQANVKNPFDKHKQLHKLSWTTLAVCMFQLAEWKYFLAFRRMFRVLFAVVVSMFWFATRRDPFVLRSAGVGSRAKGKGRGGAELANATAGDNREQEGAHWLCPRSCHLVRLLLLLPITKGRHKFHTRKNTKWNWIYFLKNIKR